MEQLSDSITSLGSRDLDARQSPCCRTLTAITANRAVRQRLHTLACAAPCSRKEGSILSVACSTAEP